LINFKGLSMADTGEITQLLHDWKGGDSLAADQLFSALMPQLRRIASGYFARERLGHTLQPTALVNEAFFRLAAAKNIDWRDRGHFLALAARVMRRYLIDHSRSRPSAEFLPMEGLPERVLASKKPAEVISVIDTLLDELEIKAPRQKSIVELKFFLGLTDTEGAEALSLTVHTFQREWYRARKWLFQRLTT
jgi:RNA polymerase sigma-70 factor, ECF subfamily